MEELKIKDAWVAGVDYPKWMIERSLVTLKGGYLVEDETPKDAKIGRAHV